MSNYKSQIESLLFISAKPMSIKQLAEVMKLDPAEVEAAGDELVESYKSGEAGIQIIKNASKYQMVSSPENARLVQEFIRDETTGELSRPSLETLTIIAYRGPISKINLDRIRGVNCSLILRNLLLRGLVEVKQDKKKGDSYYSITMDFMRFLGVNDIKELPDFDKLAHDENLDRILAEADGDKKTDEELVGEGDSTEEITESDSNDGGQEDDDEGLEAADETEKEIEEEIGEDEASSDEDEEYEDDEYEENDEEEEEESTFDEEIDDTELEDVGEIGNSEDSDDEDKDSPENS